MSAADGALLPDGVETDFGNIEATMATLAAGDRAPGAAAYSRGAIAMATVVALGPCARLLEAAVALRQHARAGAIRAILVAVGDRATPVVRVTASEIALEGLRESFINNVVAALRLPSLPALVWWRGGDADRTEDLAELADRLVLDVENPDPVWRRVDTIVKKAAVTDLRWTALTRWRSLMAHFFDMPGVPEAAAKFTSLTVEGRDPFSARLFAAWLGASLKWQDVTVRYEQQGGEAINSVSFGNGNEALILRRVPNSTCVEGIARLRGRETSRIASLGKPSLATLIAEELRVRSHDPAFERAVRMVGVGA
jgi:glucose-6-phosphate dehydrogenase assembly protein OpcA